MGGLKRVGLAVAVILAGAPSGAAFAAMGAAAIMDRIHPKDQNKITMDEARDAAGRAYDKIASAHGGTATMLQMGGRVSSQDVKAAKIGSGERDETISKADYLALASRFFGEANVSRKPNVSPADGTLSQDELSSPGGRKLVRLIE